MDNINRCRFCQRTNAGLAGHEYWATRRADCCSSCAPGRGIMIRRGCYLHPGSNVDAADKVETAREKTRRKSAKRTAAKQNGSPRSTLASD